MFFIRLALTFIFIRWFYSTGDITLVYLDNHTGEEMRIKVPITTKMDYRFYRDDTDWDSLHG